MLLDVKRVLKFGHAGASAVRCQDMQNMSQHGVAEWKCAGHLWSEKGQSRDPVALRGLMGSNPIPGAKTLGCARAYYVLKRVFLNGFLLSLVPQTSQTLNL